MFSDNGGGPNGLAIGPDGAFYLCNNGGSRYVEGSRWGWGRIPTTSSARSSARPQDRRGKPLYNECNGHKLSAPNDLVFDKAGGFYFTDLGKRYAASSRPWRHLLRAARRLEDRRTGLSDSSARTAAACRPTARRSTSPIPRALGSGLSTSKARASSGPPRDCRAQRPGDRRPRPACRASTAWRSWRAAISRWRP